MSNHPASCYSKVEVHCDLFDMCQSCEPCFSETPRVSLHLAHASTLSHALIH